MGHREGVGASSASSLSPSAWRWWAVASAGAFWCCFLNRQLDLWHTQAWYWQGALILLTGLCWTHRQYAVALPTVWMAWWVWVAGIGLYTFTTLLIQKQQYTYPLLGSVVLALVPMGAIALAIRQLDREAWWKVWDWTCWSGAGLVVYGWLQVLQLDPFFRNTAFSEGQERNILVGTMGNPNHFGVLLAMLLPWWWNWRAPLGRAVVLAAMGLVVFTWSLGVYLAVGASLAVWLLLTRHRWWGLGLLVAMLLAGGWALQHPAYASGRWEVWSTYLRLWHDRPLDGLGVGFVGQASRLIPQGSSPLYGWRHLHCEPLQLLVETGLVGATIAGGILADATRRVCMAPRTDLLIASASTLTAFLANSLVNFPGHLYLTGMLAVLAYATLLTATTETHA